MLPRRHTKTSHRRQQSKLAALLVFVFCSPTLSPAVEPLTRIEQIDALPENQIASHPPFAGQLIVTYIDRVSQVMFASDPTGSVSVHADWALLPQSLAAGDSISVSGFAQPGKVRPIINAPTIAITGSTPLPEPPVSRPTNPVEPRSLDATFVTLDTRIRHIYRTQEQFVIVGSSGDLEFTIHSPQPPPRPIFHRLHRSLVRISGNLSFKQSAPDLPLTASLYTQDWEKQCQIVTARDSPPQFDIVSLIDLSPQQTSTVRVTGTVTHVASDGNFLFADG